MISNCFWAEDKVASMTFVLGGAAVLLHLGRENGARNALTFFLHNKKKTPLLGRISPVMTIITDPRTL